MGDGHQLAGQHHAVVWALGSAQRVHVEPDERGVGPAGRVVRGADDQDVVVLGDDQLGRAGQDRVVAAEEESVVGRDVVASVGPLGLLLVQQGGVFRIGTIVGAR